jgi:hypothetical protein
MTDIFGNNKPHFTHHFIHRYAERIFNVKPIHLDSWINLNYTKFYDDLFFRLTNSKIFDYDKTKYAYFSKKYGSDVRVLKHGKFMFVVRDFKNIVTFMKEGEI